MKKMAHKKFVLLAILSLLPCLLVANTARSDSIAEFKLVSGDAKADRWFSSSVAIDGEILVIGAPFDDDGATSAGAAYVFQYDQSTSMWIETAKLTAGSDAVQGDEFGFSVAIGGNTIAVGAPGKDGNFTDSGLVYVFTYDGTAWNQLPKLAATDPSMFAEFGKSVSISNDILVVGAPLGNFFMGAAYVFTNGVNGWQEEAILTAGSDAAVGDLFGRSVTIGGDVAVIGAPFDDDNGSNSGSAYVFRYDGTTWGHETKLVASDAEFDDQFGWSIGLDSDKVLVGALFGDGEKVTNSGAAYVYTLPSSNQPPTAEAIADPEEAKEGDSVRLVGFGEDPDGDPLKYLWVQTDDGPPVKLSDPTAPDPFFIAPELTNGCATLEFELTVSENVEGGLSSDPPARVEITVVPNNKIYSELSRKHRHWLYWHKYEFEGVKDEAVTINFEPNSDGQSWGNRATLILKDKIRGVHFYKKDRSGLPNTITATLPADGKYVVYVVKQPWFCRGKNFRGDYILTLEGTCGKLRKSFDWKHRRF